MNIEELNNLAKWISVEIVRIEASYKKVQDVLQHNINQNGKQPLEAPLHDLKEILSIMAMNKLTMDQTRMLEAFGVLCYIGREGVDFIDKIEHQKELDTATAFNKVKEASSKIAEAKNRAHNINTAFNGLSIASLAPIDLDGSHSLIRIQFHNLASIENVVEWENWSKKWVAISRGIGMSVGEAPENILVVGASRGSFILDLGASAAFTKVLTGILNMVLKTAMNLVELESAREDLRHKKFLNKKIEEGLNEKIEQEKADAVQQITDQAISTILPKILDGEEKTCLISSIKELIEFHRKGGGIDVIPPKLEQKTEDNDDENIEDSALSHEERLSLQIEVEKLREQRDELKRLSDKSSD